MLASEGTSGGWRGEELSAEQREEEFDEVDEEVKIMTGAAMAGGGVPLGRHAQAIDRKKYEAVESEESHDQAFLAEGFRMRPGDRVALFDLVGDSMGYGLRAGMTEDGRVRILVTAEAIDVVGTGQNEGGEVIQDAVFVQVPPTA